MANARWDQIKELSRLVTPILPERRIELTSVFLRRSEIKTAQVLRSALAGERDESAVARSVGSKSSKDPAYKVLKTGARQRLLSSCFNLSLKRAGYSRAFQDSYRNDRYTFLAKILVSLGARQTANLIAASAFKESVRLELAANAIENALILRQASLLQGKENKHAYFTRQIAYWLGVKEAELQLEGLYDLLRIGYAKRAEPRQGDIDRAIDASEIARSKMRLYPTVSVTLFSYRILTLRAQLTKNYSVCIELCHEAENFIRSRPGFSNPARLAEFAIKRLVCCIHLRDLVHGKQAAALCGTAYKAGTNNWFVYTEQTFLLYTACLEFDAARKLWDEVTSTYNFQAQTEHRKDRWVIFDLYLQLIEGRLNSSTIVPFSNSLKFHELFNRVSTASIDKAGYNFALIVLHILYLIQQDNWSSILDRLEAIKSYRVRHLKTKHSQAAQFLQLLTNLERDIDTTTALQLMSKNRSETLQSTDPEHLDSSILEGLQIVPFDYLAGWIAKQLTQPRRNAPARAI